jgi:hypothetical protein
MGRRERFRGSGAAGADALWSGSPLRPRSFVDTRLHIYVACALIALIAVPLVLRKVGPNRWYGLRTAATLADRALWYDANAWAGWALLCAVGVIALGVGWMPPAWRLRRWPLLVVFVVPLAIAVSTSLLRARRGVSVTGATPDEPAPDSRHEDPTA